jgi:hypothetical protein
MNKASHHSPIRRSMWLITGLLIMFVLGGCATMNEKECLNADWRAVGFEDGVNGAKLSRVGQHREACAEYGVKPDLDAYKSGRDEGLNSYCRSHNGYRVGIKGGSYYDVCPAALEKDFLQGYNAGLKIYRLESRIRSLNSQLKKQEKELEASKELLTQLEAELVSDGVNSQRRVQLLGEVRDASKEQGQIENQIKTLQLDMVKLQTQVDGLRASNTYY